MPIQFPIPLHGGVLRRKEAGQDELQRHASACHSGGLGVSDVRVVQRAQEVIVARPKVFASLEEIFLALVRQMTPAVGVEGLVLVRVILVRVSWSAVAVTE